MNPTILMKLSVLLFISLSSCQGQKETNPTIKLENPMLEEQMDVDLYFIESEAISRKTGPKSITRNILQDKNGMIWLATWEGIVQYDGTTFTNFTNKEGLRRYHVFAVFEDSSGILWFGTIGAGVYRYDGSQFVNLSTKDGLISDRVGCFYEDKNGNIWIGTDGGISVYNGTNFTNYTTEDGLMDQDINSIVEDEDGNVWIGARGEACMYDGITFSKITNEEQSFTNVRSIIKDVKGNIWLGGNDGLWRFDGKEFSQISEQFVGFIYEDSKENIWTNSVSATSKEEWVFSYYSSKDMQNDIIKPTPILQKQDMFFGIFEDAQEGIWLGTLNGPCRYDGNTFDYFQKPISK